MWFAVCWFVATLAVAAIAYERERNAALWFFVALLISPLIAVIIVLALPNLRRERLEQQRHEELMRAMNPSYSSAIVLDGQPKLPIRTAEVVTVGIFLVFAFFLVFHGFP